MEFIPEGVIVKNAKRYFPVYAIQFIISFDAGRTGCSYMITPLHITLGFFKRSWQNNRSQFIHTIHIHLILHHAITISFPA
jgi:hypothetical protein